VDDLVDLSAVPVDRRRLWESHVHALTTHQPRPYCGKVILLRTRGHPLNCSYDGQCGWGEFALGGVSVRTIPGLHESLPEEPNVEALARELKVPLDAIERHCGVDCPFDEAKIVDGRAVQPKALNCFLCSSVMRSDDGY
jgi:hypothetical protein